MLYTGGLQPCSALMEWTEALRVERVTLQMGSLFTIESLSRLTVSWTTGLIMRGCDGFGSTEEQRGGTFQ